MFLKKNFFLICSSFLFIGRHTLSGTQCLQQPPRKDVTFEEFVKSYSFIFYDEIRDQYKSWRGK